MTSSVRKRLFVLLMLCPQHLVYSKCSLNTLVNVGKTMGQHAFYVRTHVYKHSLYSYIHRPTHTVYSLSCHLILQYAQDQRHTLEPEASLLSWNFTAKYRREIEQISQLITVSLDVA